MIYRSGLMIALILFLTVGAAGQSAGPSFTPGTLALMGGQPDASNRILQALTDPDALTRTVAARLTGIRGETSDAAHLGRALEKETDRFAEAEMVRALLFLGGESALDGLTPRLQRAAPGTTVVVANWVAQALPDQFVARLPQFAERLGPQVGRLRSAVLIALHQRPALAGPIFRAWLGVANLAGWISVSRDRSVDLAAPAPAAVVLDALRSSNADTREATVWMLLFRLSRGQTVPAALLDAAMAPESVRPSSEQDLTWEALGRELIARHQGRTMPERPEFLAREAGRHPGDVGRIAVLSRITRSEERALQAAMGDRFRSRDTMKSLDDSPTGGAMRILPIPWPGFFASLVTAARCDLSAKRQFAAIRATYREDGRRERPQIDVTTMSPGCANVIEALARLLVADPDQRPVGPEGEWVLVPMDSSFLACASQPESADAEPIRLADGEHTRVTMPTKVHSQAPTYPPGAMRGHIQGVVVLESVISSDGCPATLRLLHGVEPSLDAEALKTASAWRYTPATASAPRMPVMVLLSMRFSLR